MHSFEWNYALRGTDRNRARERERKREIKGIRWEKKKNLRFPRGSCCSVAATTVVFQALVFLPGRRSHHAHQFALRYKLSDRLYPDYGVTRYRTVFECGGTHDTLTPHCRARVPRPSFLRRLCVWVGKICSWRIRVYKTHRRDWSRSRNNYPEGLAFILNYTMCRVYHCDLCWLTEKGYAETDVKDTKDARYYVSLTHSKNATLEPRWVTLIRRFLAMY